jgi:endonuclease G
MKVRGSLADAARSRINASREPVGKVQEATYSGRPLDAEPEEDRKIRRFEAVAGVSTDQARKLANYERDALSGLAGEKRLGAERIQGKTTDFVGVSFLELAAAAAATVGRVVHQDLQALGSGFMISNKLFLTNNHVIQSKEQAKQLLVSLITN